MLFRSGEVRLEEEKQWSTYNFEIADVGMLKRHFNEWEEQVNKLVGANLPLPAYDAVMKCSHLFNLLDARGAISVSERVGYVLRVRTLARNVAQEYLKMTEKEDMKND